MREEKIVQFVSFETILDRDQFIRQWEHYTRSVNSDLDVTLQQSFKKSGFRYIAQHRCPAGEFKFIFAKGGRSSRTPEVEIKARQAGGYTLVQCERRDDTHANENKIFVFLVNHPGDLEVYKKLSGTGKLNIYEAYYENCQYACIMEFFVSLPQVPALLQALKLQTEEEIGVYHDCLLEAV